MTVTRAFPRRAHATYASARSSTEPLACFEALRASDGTLSTEHAAACTSAFRAVFPANGSECRAGSLPFALAQDGSLRCVPKGALKAMSSAEQAKVTAVVMAKFGTAITSPHTKGQIRDVWSRTGSIPYKVAKTVGILSRAHPRLGMSLVLSIALAFGALYAHNAGILKAGLARWNALSPFARSNASPEAAEALVREMDAPKATPEFAIQGRFSWFQWIPGAAFLGGIFALANVDNQNLGRRIQDEWTQKDRKML